MTEILVVDDELAVRRGLSRLLSAAGYAARVAANGEEARQEVARRRPDLVLLDVMMSGEDGLSVCRDLRLSDPELPILFLTALDDADSTLRGFGVGADDYLAKTTPPAVILAKVAAVLHRAGVTQRIEPFRFGASTVDPNAMTLTRPDGKTCRLIDREVMLLRLLVSQRGVPVTADWLLSRLWGPSNGVSEAALRQAIHRLREKLGGDANSLKAVRPGMFCYD